MNDYYTATLNPTARSPATSATIRAEFALIEDGFDAVDAIGLLSRSLTSFDGADATGATSSAAAWALAEASSVTEIYVPNGTFLLGACTASKRYYGPGTLKWAAAAAVPMLTLEEGAHLEGLTLDGNASAQSASVEMVVTSSAPGARLTRLNVANGRYKFLVTDVKNSPGVVVEDCTFRDWGTVSTCDVLTMRSPRPQVLDNDFESIGDGHCIRLGLLGGDATTDPVTGAVVRGNKMRDTDHNGITLEIYTQGARIIENEMRNMESGVKIEEAGGTCVNNIITHNVLEDLADATPCNVVGVGTVFSFNQLKNLAGPLSLGADTTAEGNLLDNVGIAASKPSIEITSARPGGKASGNIIKNAPYRGISASGANWSICDNQINDCADAAIRVGADNVTVRGNKIDGCTDGILTASTATNCTISGGNSVANASGTAYSLSSVSFLTMFIDASNVGYIGTSPTLTVASGAITAPRFGTGPLALETEGAAASDDLDTINISGGGYIGQIIVLRLVTAAHVTTAKDGTGNLHLAGDWVPNSSDDRLTLIWDGSQWDEISRSNN